MSNETKYFESMYNVRAMVPDHQSYFRNYKHLSEKFKEARFHRATLDVSYGEHKLETMDIFQPKGPSGSLLMFIHGGYWRSLDKGDFSFVAEPFVKSGATVAIINYSLCPKVSVSDICREIVGAGSFLYRNSEAIGFPKSKMYVAGHSAGGHLATMALACQWRQVDYRFPPKLFGGGVSISGLYDLRPLVHVPSVNQDLRLSKDSAKKVSPALMTPPQNVSLIVAVGDRETGGFHDQHQRIVGNWGTVVSKSLICNDKNHFDIIFNLADHDHLLGKNVLEMIGSEDN